MADDPEAPPPGLDMNSLLGMAMDLQQQMAEAQELAAEAVVEGQAGGGAVRIEVTGGFEFRSVSIAAAAVDPDDVEMLQDLVLAAIHDAVARVGELNAASNPLAGMDLGSLDLGGLAGMFGGGGLVDDDDDGLEVVEVESGDTDALELDPRQIDAIAAHDGDEAPPRGANPT